MEALTSYCAYNESLLSRASEARGLPRCVMETFPTSIVLGLILLIAIFKCIRRTNKDGRKDSFSYQDLESPQSFLDSNGGLKNVGHVQEMYSGDISNPIIFIHGDNRTSFFYSLQQFLHVCLIILPVVTIITNISIEHLQKIQGVDVFYCGSTLLAWVIAFVVLRYESACYFKAKIEKHSFGLILFWTLSFLSENLSFISWNNKNWWFHLDSSWHKVEFGLFVTRYTCSLLLFLLGMMGPGLYKPEPVFEAKKPQKSTESEVASDRTGQSAYKDLLKKLKLLWPFLWPKDRWLQLRVIICFILLGLGRAVNVLIPYSYKLIVNSLNGNKADIRDPYALIGLYVVLKLFGGGIGGFLSNLRTFVWIKIQQFTGRTLQVKLFEHLHNLSLRWHITRKTGEVITMVNRGSNSIYSLLSYILFNIFPTIADIAIAIVYFIIAFNGWFGLIVFITMTAYLTATILITEWRTKYRREMNLKDNEAKAKAVDSLLNFETVKYYAGEEFEVNRLNDAIIDYQQGEWKVLGSLALLNIAQSIIINIGLLSGTMYCGHLVVIGDLDVGEFVQFITYMVQLYVPLNFFGTYYRMIQQSFIDMENMFDLFAQKHEITDDPNATELQVQNGMIKFENVVFHYEPSKAVLKNISFTVYPGQTVALVGNSGGGKSTIIRLLYRFYDVDGGSISIDDQDISKVTQKSLRKAIGVVPQDTVLFNNNIRFNIRYGKLTSSDNEVEGAAQAADIHSRILSFPQGYDTRVGERGLKLSGGEKQRVAIARTVLKNPSLVLLDEATSALDTQTERNIQASLNSICIDRTTIVVAHRLSTIVNADQILVLTDGEIIERGRHDELLALDGHYASMWQQQSSAADEEGSLESTKEKVL